MKARPARARSAGPEPERRLSITADISSEFVAPKQRANPKTKKAEAKLPSKKYFNAASDDFSS